MPALSDFPRFIARGINRFFPPRPTMRASLAWLARSGFEVTTVIDVGASDGRWSRLCMRSFPGANYVLFEPNPLHSRALDDFALSDSRVRVVNKAVADHSGEIAFAGEDAFGGGIVRQGDAEPGTIRVPVTTLDEALEGAPSPVLLKLDTHGFEKAILDGGAKLLERASVLIIEAYNFRITHEALRFWELCIYLSSKGFVVADLVDIMHRPLDGAFWQCDIVFVRETWTNSSVTVYR